MKTNYLKHKNYLGSVEFDIGNGILFGKILFINDIVTYEGLNIPDLTSQFKEAIVDYLATCKALNREPQKAHSGSLNIRIGEEIHKDAALIAFKQGKNLNEFIKDAISEKISSYQIDTEPSQVNVTIQHVYKSEKTEVPTSDISHVGEDNIFTKFNEPYIEESSKTLH